MKAAPAVEQGLEAQLELRRFGIDHLVLLNAVGAHAVSCINRASSSEIFGLGRGLRQRYVAVQQRHRKLERRVPAAQFDELACEWPRPGVTLIGD